MIIASDLELRVGARLLLAPASFQVGPGDRIGLVGRNGAGKTTLTKVLAGEAIPAAGKVTRTGTVGYLPQDPRTGDLDVVARDRILSARGIDEVLRQLRVAEQKMASEVPKIRDQGVRAYARLEERLHVLGGYAAEAEAASIASSLGLEQRILTQPLRTLSGGQRRRVELARILFSGADTLLLDEPTNHLDGDSIAWLRDFLKSYQGGLVVISHDVDLIEARRQQGVLPGCQPQHSRHLQHGLAGLPGTAGGRRAAPQAERANAEKQAAALQRRQARVPGNQPGPRRPADAHRAERLLEVGRGTGAGPGR